MFKIIFKRVVKVIKHVYQEVKDMANQIREDKKEITLSVVEVAGKTVETVSNNKKDIILAAGHGCKEMILSAGHGCKEMIDKILTDDGIKQTLGLIGIALLASTYLPKRKEV